MRIGVYLASHNNPLFLRLALLQLEAQTRKPSVIALHENGHQEKNCQIINMDVLNRLSAYTKIIHDHNVSGLGHPFFHYLPLKRLVDTRECDYYTKFDHDDLFYENHLSYLHDEMLTGNYSWVGQRKADILILREPEYFFRRCRNFIWNPLGGMSDTFMFNDDVARALLEDMIARAGTGDADDLIMHKYTFPKFKNGIVLDSRATTCYVAHGRNDSSKHWMRKPPEEIV